MPGRELSFRCPCGFRKDRVSVGATEMSHYHVVLCLDCHLLLSISRRSNNWQDRESSPICRKCGKPYMTITAPGAWEPAALQNKFLDMEPWLLEDGDYFVEEPTDDELAQIENIRILCPKCGSYSLEYEIQALWD